MRRTMVALALLTLTGCATDLSDCIIVSPYGTVLTDPVPGEDDGTLYCPR